MADPGSGYGGPDSASQSAGAAMGAADAAASGFNDDAGQGGAAPAGSSASPAGYGSDRGFFGGLLDSITNQVTPGTALSTAGLLMGSPALAMMGGLASLGSYLGGKFGGTNTGPIGPGPGDGPAQVQQIVPPAFNPIEDMIGSEYVAYGGVGADQLRKQLFPYMNFNQQTQPGISGLVGSYAPGGQGTGLMTGPFGMSNTQV